MDESGDVREWWQVALDHWGIPRWAAVFTEYMEGIRGPDILEGSAWSYTYPTDSHSAEGVEQSG